MLLHWRRRKKWITINIIRKWCKILVWKSNILVWKSSIVTLHIHTSIRSKSCESVKRINELNIFSLHKPSTSCFIMCHLDWQIGGVFSTNPTSLYFHCCYMQFLRNFIGLILFWIENWSSLSRGVDTIFIYFIRLFFNIRTSSDYVKRAFFAHLNERTFFKFYWKYIFPCWNKTCQKGFHEKNNFQFRMIPIPTDF